MKPSKPLRLCPDKVLGGMGKGVGVEGEMWVRYIFCPSVAAKRGISSWRSGEARPAMWDVVVIGWCRMNVSGKVPL